MYGLYTDPSEEMSQPLQVVGNTASALIGPKFEPQTSRFAEKRVTAPPTGRYQYS